MSGFSSGSIVTLTSITQLMDGASWTAMTSPIPNHMLTLDAITGEVKRGDGVTLYADLPTIFNVNSIIALSDTLSALQTDFNYSIKSTNDYSGSGTTQDTATLLSSGNCFLIGPNTHPNFRLPAWPQGTEVRVINLIDTTTVANIYPDDSAAIGTLSTNTPITLDANVSTLFIRRSSILWEVG